ERSARLGLWQNQGDSSLTGAGSRVGRVAGVVRVEEETYIGSGMEDFLSAEQHSLSPFFTNLTEPVFGLKLPQEIARALFSRYSRSTKSLRRIFADEFLGNSDLLLDQLPGGSSSSTEQSAALKKAREFYDRVLVGYGDDSVAQLGGAHVACEQISNVTAKLVEDARIGIAPLEKSTRYVRFDAKEPNGDYLFYKEPKIMTSVHR